MTYETVLFDLDGTLIDSYAALARAVNDARRLLGYAPLDVESIKGCVGEGVERLLERVFAPGKVPSEAQSMFEACYDAVCCDESRLLDEVGETLSRLDSAGVAMAVCTNKPTHFSQKILGHLGVAGFFRAVVGPDLAGARKPAAEHVLYTLRETGGAVDRTLFVGDMPIDVAAARASGLAVAVVATGSSGETALRESAPDFFLDRFSDVLRVVRNGRPS